MTSSIFMILIYKSSERTLCDVLMLSNKQILCSILMLSNSRALRERLYVATNIRFAAKQQFPNYCNSFAIFTIFSTVIPFTASKRS